MRRELIDIHEARINEFMTRLNDQKRVLEESTSLNAEYMVTENPVSFENRENPEYTYNSVAKGDTWGSAWQSAWFHITGSVPSEWSGRDVALHLNLNGEACVFDAGGCPVYGLTNQSVMAANSGKYIYRMFEPCSGGETIDLWVEAAANSLFGINRNPDLPRMAPHRHGNYEGKVIDLELCLFDTNLWHFQTDMEVLISLYKVLPDSEPRKNRILEGLNEAVNAFGDSRKNTVAARKKLLPVLKFPSNPADLNVTAVGHAHIDTGWLWPVRESVRKCARTFSSQIALMERYSDYVFGASQPQHYAFVKERYPALYKKIKHYIKEGRWECQGAMWVEADCNLTSGESLVRQFLHGKNFFMDEFGVDVCNLWIPDVFGYSAALPQIMKKCGVDTFLTQKLSWNKHNEFPHNTFKWRGIDGTEVLVHFPPENDYNGSLFPKELIEAQQRFKENSFMDEFMSLFGIGNGGGGPKEEHIERALRLRSLNGAPRVSFGRADDFFKRISHKTADLETWVGELYLEVHRGTLTTQAETKKGNRSLELALRETEMFCSCLPLNEYPLAELDQIWKKLLINQFHDILPGSSIHMVYEKTLQEYSESLTACRKLIDHAAERLFTKNKDSMVVFNSLTIPYTAPICLPDEWSGHEILDESDNVLPAQQEENGPVIMFKIPGQSFVTIKKGKKKSQKSALTTGLVLENSLIRYEFSEDATINRIYDKEAKREIIPPDGKGNLLSLYIDRPHCFDAWDIDIWYEKQFQEHSVAVSHETLIAGSVRSGIKFNLSIGESAITQEIYLSVNSRRLDIETDVDWRESHKMLRVSFPTTVMSDTATHDIQYGYLDRPTHRNTSWDMARFEVASQKYADLSDKDSGVALLNNCKYGYKVHNNILDLNLLRSPSEPDPDADYGHHSFTYCLLPHTGSLIESDVIDQAAMLNQPPMFFDGYSQNNIKLPCKLEAKAITLEVLKKAEKEESLIIRLVETYGRFSTGILNITDPAMQLVETNLMEWTDGESTSCDKPIEISLKPFEIRTYKLIREKS